jgi:hypothetical protein
MCASETVVWKTRFWSFEEELGSVIGLIGNMIVARLAF